MNTSPTPCSGIQHLGHRDLLPEENITLETLPAYLQKTGGTRPDLALAAMQRATRNCSDMKLRRPGVFENLERAIHHVSISHTTQLELAGYLIARGPILQSSPLHPWIRLLNDIFDDLRKTGAPQIAPEQVAALSVHLKGRIWDVVQYVLRPFGAEDDLDFMEETLEELIDTCLLQGLQPARGGANTIASLQELLYILSHGRFDDALEALLLQARAQGLFRHNSAEVFWRSSDEARGLIFHDALQSAQGVSAICEQWLPYITISEARELLETLAKSKDMDKATRQMALEAMEEHYSEVELDEEDFEDAAARDYFVACIQEVRNAILQEEQVDARQGMVLLHSPDRSEPEKLLNRKRER